MSLNLVQLDFSHDSALAGLCYASHTRKRKADLGIFRGPEIEYEGHLDICQACIEGAATQLGWVPEKKIEEQRNMTKAVADQLDEAYAEVNRLKVLLSAYETISPPEDPPPKPEPRKKASAKSD